MAQVIDANSEGEGGFVLASLMEFMKALESRAKSRQFLETTNESMSYLDASASSVSQQRDISSQSKREILKEGGA